MRTWMVRAGKGGRFFDEFRDKSIVAIGWDGIGDLARMKTRDEIANAVRAASPNSSEQSISMTAGQLYRFAREFQIGDRVVTYDPRARRYLCGRIAGDYNFQSGHDVEEFLNTRTVEWQKETSREDITETSRNSLGAISTIFSIPPAVSADLWGDDVVPVGAQNTDEPIPAANGLSGVESATRADQLILLANEVVKDRIAKISWDDMQELVAGLLRAMGYKTVVSPAGSDRGRDILASPDGFGLEEPRIIVEVKHRPNQRMGSSEIRSFLGGRHPRDRGLYVSTGGFSKEAYYEADRASIPVSLLDFESLVSAITEHYEKLDEATKQIIPLTRIYWPVTS